MSFEPRETVGARRTPNMYPYERGTLLRVKTKCDGVVQGLILQNPTKTPTPTSLELTKCYTVDPSGEEDDFIGTLRLTSDEIISATVIKPPEQKRPKLPGKLATEYINRTVIINTVKKFDKLIEEDLKNVDEVGLNFYGIYVGRDGKIGWICLSFPGVLVNIDVVALEPSNKNFWKKLDEALFSNKTIKKVMYNSRPILDHVYHQFSFSMKGVYDLQVADFMIWSADKGHEAIQKSKEHLQYSSLDSMLEEYLAGKFLPEEVELLKWMDRQDFTKKSPLMERPISDPRLCKCVAIQMKYLLPLKKAMEERMLAHFSNCMRAQMESMSLQNNYVMELHLSKPLMVPPSVVDEYYNFFYKGRTAAAADGRSKKVTSSQPISQEVTSSAPFQNRRGRGRGRGRVDQNQSTFFGYK